MSIESFTRLMSQTSSKIDGILQNYAVSGWVDSVAKVLIFVKDQEAERIILGFPQNIQEQIRQKIKYFNENPDEAYPTILHVMNTYDETDGNDYAELIEEMHTVPFYDAEQIIDQCAGKNVILAEKIKTIRVGFEDISQMDDRSIQKILREVSSSQLALSLKIASQEVKEKIFRNMSRRAAALLKEDIEFLGPVRKTDVLNAQNHIISCILQLEDAGEILLNFSNDSELVV